MKWGLSSEMKSAMMSQLYQLALSKKKIIDKMAIV